MLWIFTVLFEESSFHLGCGCIVEIAWGGEECFEDVDYGLGVGADFAGNIGDV